MKRTKAMLPLLFCALVFAMAASAIAPSAAAPPTPSLTAPAGADTIAPSDPEWGSCRWYCGSKSYATRAECQSKCAFPCEDIC
jgi:hypothetical protein